MPRTRHRSAVEQPITERSALVHACAGRRVELTVDVVDHDLLAIDFDGFERTGRHIVYIGNFRALSHENEFYNPALAATNSEVGCGVVQTRGYGDWGMNPSTLRE